ncbi:MAG: carboxypeptidase regulatory-like domain-containing protein, partial [Acidobacteriota bacterium]|nr:carboxypeptidase regulatory-like domain-containing protein [Acidobacteriota bacterium]
MKRFLCAFFLSLLSFATLTAQTNRGGLSGNVTDSSGAMVPGAVIVIVNAGTNETRRITASSKGSFIQENLDPVTYRIEVSAPGFKKSVLEGVKVDTSTVATVNPILQPGDVASEVTIEANAAIVNTESGTLGQTISARMLNDTPLPTRSVLDLAITVGNVTGDVGTSDPQLTGGAPLPGFNLQANGGRAGSTNILADGINNTGVGLAREAVSFSPESVQEFTVQTNGFDAQYGKSGGGIISITTKSGTNSYNGLALWYARNPAANASPFTQALVNRPVNNLRWNQFDGQFGGPVVIPKLYNGRNRTFFFFAAEPRYQSDKQQQVAAVPTDAMRAGDFSDLVQLAGQNAWVPAALQSQFPASAFLPNNNPNIYNQFVQVGNQFLIAPLPTGSIYPQFPGNKIPSSMLDPTSLKLLQFVPKSNTPYFLDSNGVLQNYVTYQYLSNQSTRYNTKIDHNFGTNNHASFRWTTAPVVGISANDPAYPTNGNSGTYSKSKQYTLSDTQIISPTVVNELRLAYTRADFSGQLSPRFDVVSGENLSTEFGLPSQTKGGLPLINIYDNGNSPANIGSQPSTLGYSLEQQYEIADNVYVTRGSSTWKFGVDLSRALLNDQSLYSIAGGNYQFRYLQTDQTGAAGVQSAIGGNAVASFLLGVPQSIVLANTAIPYYYRWGAAAGYVQNDWRVRPNLTINIGLRYSLQLPRTENNNLQGFLDPSQAKTTQLATPCQLPDCLPASAVTGLPVISQATVVPFAFSGYGGRSPYLTPIHWLDFEPRFGFAYTPSLSLLRAWVVRGGYGISHAPLTGQNRNPVPNFTSGAANYGETAGQTFTSPLPLGDGTTGIPVTRLSSNPPFVASLPVKQVLGLADNPSGLVYNTAVTFPGNVITGKTDVPYLQNWSLSLQRQVGSHGVFELSYAGSKGTHLYMPAVVLNNPPSSYLASLVNLNIKATTTVPDPLGRKNSSGGALTVPLFSLASQYLGYSGVSSFFDASGNSSFHSALVSYRWQARHLTMYTNFRWSKSIDNASDASPDKNSLTTGSVGGGQYSFGATAASDRSVSTFNIPYAWNLVAVYDLPYGKGQMFGNSAWAPLQFAFGNWNISGVERLTTGYPFTPTIATDTYIDTFHTHEIRPNIIPNVPLINPDWKRSCPTGAQCAPYVNYSAFELPVAGQLGNAPRTVSGITGPLIQTLDLSVQKNFQLGEKRRIQFRVDALNALNHPVFRTAPNVGGGTDLFGNYPSFTWTAATLQSVYTSWAMA